MKKEESSVQSSTETAEDEVNRRLASRGDYTPMTQEDLDEWNRQRIKNLRPLSPRHWTHKARRRRRLVLMAWYYSRWFREARDEAAALREENEALRNALDRANRRPFTLG